MIISDKHKYVFIEVPHTGSTAISKELKEKYDGEEILYKHANYHEFLEVADQKQKEYFVFAGVRNPLDEAVSLYYKFLTDHKSNYTDPSKLLKNGGWVTERKVRIYNFVQATKDFGKFLGKFYPRTYTSNANINKKYCDYIMRFENLDSDLTEALSKIKVDKARPLPIVNKTKDRGDFTAYYTDKISKNAINIFGPFMKEWGYEVPEKWGNMQPSLKARVAYKYNKLGRFIYSKYVKGGPLQRFTLLRDLLE